MNQRLNDHKGEDAPEVNESKGSQNDSHHHHSLLKNPVQTEKSLGNGIVTERSGK